MIRTLVAIAVVSLTAPGILDAQEDVDDRVFCLALTGGKWTPPMPRRIRVFSFTADSIPPEVPEYWTDSRLVGYLPVKSPDALGLRSGAGLVIGLDMTDRGSQLTLHLRYEGEGQYRGMVAAVRGGGFFRPQGPRTVSALVIDCRE